MMMLVNKCLAMSDIIILLLPLITNALSITPTTNFIKQLAETVSCRGIRIRKLEL